VLVGSTPSQPYPGQYTDTQACDMYVPLGRG
jgi:hypothetical protein